MGDWYQCDHEWEEIVDSQFSNDKNVAVECKQCGAPGKQGSLHRRSFLARDLTPLCRSERKLWGGRPTEA